MSERINLAMLKDAASDSRGFTWKRCGPEVVALVEAVEAADAYRYEPGWSQGKRLADALARFEFEERP